ncbi:MAG: DTW domain-containing protein [Myxococcales bacterium]|nr:DTW domain-containing protein [Myxococcales bacterium]
MLITLLTHNREFNKRSNTGQLVLQVLGEQAEQIRWDRLLPPTALMRQIEAGGVALVYPSATSDYFCDISNIQQFILIDGTWLAARKMYHRSPYLHNIPRVSLQPSGPSRYNLRPNQKIGGLCTAECVIEILQKTDRVAEAESLQQRFLGFIKSPAMLRGEARALLRDAARKLGVDFEDVCA